MRGLFIFTAAFGTILIIAYAYNGIIWKDSNRHAMNQYSSKTAEENRSLRIQNSFQLEKTLTKDLKLSNQTKVILWWQKERWLKESHGTTVFKNCEYRNCYITDNKTEFSLQSIDVIMVHYKIYKPIEALPVLKDSKTKYVFFNNESPSRVLSHKSLLPYKDKFHWTIGYDTANDIPR